jgi:DNA-binding CsgD family transcriptional regulator
MVAVIDRDYVEAVQAIARLDAVAEARGEGWLHSFAPDHVNTLVSAGHVDAARARGERMLVTLSDAGIEYAAIALRAALARVEAASGNPSAAAELAVRAADEAETIDGTFLPAMVRSYAGEALLAAGRRALACEILIDASARLANIGVVWRAAEITKLLAAAGVTGAAPVAVDAARAAGPLDVLSERERSVAQLAGRGMRSRSIGVTLSISERTVENHLANVYAKLGIRSRAQLIALCADGTAP